MKYDLQEVALRDDGGVVLICENQYIQVHTTYNNGRTSTYYTYHYDNVLVINVNPAGKIDWATAIPKRAHEQSPFGMYVSYVAMVKGDKIFILFNDNLKNYALDIDKEGVYESAFTGKNGVMSMVTISADGKSKREKLFETQNIAVIPRPIVSKQISDNEIFLIGDYKKTDQFAIITFK